MDRVLFNNVIDELLLRCKDISLLREEEVDGKNDDDDDEKPITPTTTPCRRNEEANDDIIKIDVIIMYGVCWYIVFASFFYLCSRYADVLHFCGGEERVDVSSDVLAKIIVSDMHLIVSCFSHSLQKWKNPN